MNAKQLCPDSTHELRGALQPSRISHASRWPIVSLAVLVASALLLVFPTISTAIQYDPAAILAGQWWRVLTGHFVHWSGNHFLWDGIAFVALSLPCERRNRGRLLACILASASVISAAMLVFLPELSTYRGLSGIDSALLVLLAVTMLRENLHALARRPIDLLPVLLLTGFLAKMGYELVTGATLFADSADFTPVPLAHLIGAGVGLCVACLW